MVFCKVRKITAVYKIYWFVSLHLVACKESLSMKLICWLWTFRGSGLNLGKHIWNLLQNSYFIGVYVGSISVQKMWGRFGKCMLDLLSCELLKNHNYQVFLSSEWWKMYNERNSTCKWYYESLNHNGIQKFLMMVVNLSGKKKKK